MIMAIKNFDFKIGKTYKIHSLEKCFKVCGMVEHSQHGLVYVGEDTENFCIFPIPLQTIDDGDIEEL